jgi:hypothetical protein
MDYVRAGQVKRLGPDQTIVLSYRASCVRETITGGTIVIDTRQSEIKSGKVRRSGDKPCNVGRIGQLKGEEAGGRTRGQSSSLVALWQGARSSLEVDC